MKSNIYKTKYRRYRIVLIGIYWYVVHKPIGVYHCFFTNWKGKQKFEKYMDASLCLSDQLIMDRLEERDVQWNTIEEAREKYKTITI